VDHGCHDYHDTSSEQLRGRKFEQWNDVFVQGISSQWDWDRRCEQRGECHTVGRAECAGLECQRSESVGTAELDASNAEFSGNGIWLLD
jgi:hypothetical protein